MDKAPVVELTDGCVLTAFPSASVSTQVPIEYVTPVAPLIVCVQVVVPAGIEGLTLLNLKVLAVFPAS